MADEDPMYQPLYDHAMDLQYKFHDFSGGNENHPQSQVLQHEIHQLVQDIAVQRNPHTIEDRIKTIQRQLSEQRHTADPVMHYDHADYMHKSYEQMRQGMRKFNNY